MLRDLPMGAWYPLVQFCDKSGSGENDLYLCTDEQIVDRISTLNQPYIPFLRYVGLIEMADIFHGTMMFASTATREELRRFARSFLRYLNRYTSYALFYFDWEALGERYTYNSLSASTTPNITPGCYIAIEKGQKIRITWDKLGFIVYGHLATRNNPDLCADFTQMLPFEVLHTHALVSGDLTYAWVPGVSIAPTLTRQRLCDASIGRLFFSQAAGMKVMLNHGHISENPEVAVLGDILPQYHGILADLGKALWTSTYRTKEPIMIRVELADEQHDTMFRKSIL